MPSMPEGRRGTHHGGGTPPEDVSTHHDGAGRVPQRAVASACPMASANTALNRRFTSA